jgi:RNA-binding protein YlmH
MPQNEQQPFLDAKMRRLEQVASNAALRLADHITCLENEIFYTDREMRQLQSDFETEVYCMEQKQLGLYP